MMNEYQKFIHTSRYSRWLEDEGRRETWLETVNRYVDNILRPKLSPKDCEWLKSMILDMKVVPSMRAMMSAGPAAERDNTCMYNCYYNAVDSAHSFKEALHILCCGTGVGFSVERKYVSKLPEVPLLKDQPKLRIIVRDSKEGWADALGDLLDYLYMGHIPSWDTSLVRPKGARLKTFGGRASGPEPLEDLFRFVINIFTKAQGRKLSPLECHDIMCKIGEIVVVGGVRRSAMISLSDADDVEMANAKSGEWWVENPQRALANNSAVYNSKPSSEDFLRDWLSLVESRSGERGIFNREASRKQAERFGRRNPNHSFGTNPCSEIILRPGQFCNLTEVIVREGDSLRDLQEKVEAATILGTVQATYTHFPFLRNFITENTEEERLLGVSLTGIFDNKLMTKRGDALEDILTILRETARDTNREFASILGIPESTAITCVKPSGTVSQLTDASSGIHPRYAPFYIRTVRGDNKDPLTEFMKAKEFPHEPCVMQPDDITVFSFPMKAPDGAIHDISAIDHLKLWLDYQKDWCEHKPSITVTVKPHEWFEVGAFVYKHFDVMSGVSFLPSAEGHTYRQAPYQEIKSEDYFQLLKQLPGSVDWRHLSLYEYGDHTKSSQTLACTGDVCEVVDI